MGNKIVMFVLAVVLALAFTAGLVFLLKPGDAYTLGGIAGAVVSLVLAYVPGIVGWYEGLEKSQKQQINILIMVIVAAAIFGFSCAGFIDVGIACSGAGVVALVEMLLFELIGNAAAYVALKYNRR